MSVKVVALPNPVEQHKRITKSVMPQRICDVHRGLSWVIPLDSCVFQVNGVPESDRRRVLADGDELVIVGVPRGGGNSRELRNAGTASKIGGAVVAAIGTALVLTGFGAPIGVALIGSGVSMMVGGVVLYNTDLPSMKSRRAGEQDPSLSGGKNRLRRAGETPLILGRHRISPDVAALPYTSLISDAQYLHQLFCVGQKDLMVNSATLKIGDTPIDSYQGVDVEVFDWDGGGASALYPSVVKEQTVGLEVQQAYYMTDEFIERRTPENTRQIDVEIVFPNGLIRYKNNGNDSEHAAFCEVQYKPAGSDVLDYQVLGYFESPRPAPANHIEASKYESLGYVLGSDGWLFGKTPDELRLQVSKTLDNADASGADWVDGRQYDVRIRRFTPVRSDAKRQDAYVWAVLRATDTDTAPIRAEEASRLTWIALRIKATDQLNGVVDEFNLVAQSRCRVYAGTGTGPSAWTQLSATSNPAALWLYALTNGSVNAEPATDDEIDWPTIEAWYEWCESHGYTCDVVSTNGEAAEQLLEAIATTGRASYTMVDTKHSVVLDAERTAPVQLITPRNSSGYRYSKQFPLLPHALDGQFIDATGDEYKPNNRIVYADGYSADGAGETDQATDIREVELWGCTNADFAYRLLMYQMAVSRLRPERHSVSMGIEHIVATRGDWVRLQHPVPLFGLVSGRIKAVTVDSGTGAIIGLTLDEPAPMEAGKSYAIRVRGADGTWYSSGVVTAAGVQAGITLIDPWPAGAQPAAGDLYAFGEEGLETVDCIVAAIEPGSDWTARLTLVEYAPEIFGVDDPGFVIPAFDSKMTKSGSAAAAAAVPSALEQAVQATKSGYLEIASQGLTALDAMRQAGRYVGEWEINAETAGVDFAFPPVPLDDVDHMRLSVEHTDLETAVRVLVNGTEIDPSIDGADNTREWWTMLVPSIVLLTDADNVVRIERVDGADFGTIHQVTFVFDGAANAREYADGLSHNALFVDELFATKATIAGWQMDEALGTLSGGDATLDADGILTLGTGNDVIIVSADDATHRLAIGNSTMSSAPFRVTKAGAVTAESGTIGGWTISPGKLSTTEIDIDATLERILVGGTDGIEINADDRRISVYNSLTTTMVAMGYLEGLPNPAGGNYGAGVYGLYIADSAEAVIETDLQLSGTGKSLINESGSFIIRDGSGNNQLLMGDVGGDIGYHWYDASGTLQATAYLSGDYVFLTHALVVSPGVAYGPVGSSQAALELRTRGGSTEDIPLRFHNPGHWWSTLWASDDGFHFTNGANSTYQALHAGSIYLPLQSGQSRVFQALAPHNYYSALLLGEATNYGIGFIYNPLGNNMLLATWSNVDMVSNMRSPSRTYLRVSRDTDDFDILTDITFQGALYLNNTTSYISRVGTDAIRMTTQYGYVDIGPVNSGWAHVNTDRANFYVGRGLHAAGDIVVYDTQHKLTSTGLVTDTITGDGRLDLYEASGDLAMYMTNNVIFAEHDIHRGGGRIGNGPYLSTFAGLEYNTSTLVQGYVNGSVIFQMVYDGLQMINGAEFRGPHRFYSINTQDQSGRYLTFAQIWNHLILVVPNVGDQRIAVGHCTYDHNNGGGMEYNSSQNVWSVTEANWTVRNISRVHRVTSSVIYLYCQADATDWGSRNMRMVITSSNTSSRFVGGDLVVLY